MPRYAILVREYFQAKIMGGGFGVVAMISTWGMTLGPPVGDSCSTGSAGCGWLDVASSAIAISGALIATPRGCSCRGLWHSILWPGI